MCLRGIIYFIVSIRLIANIYAKFEFTNINCIGLNDKCMEFEYCHLKSINRSYKYASVKARLNTLPLNNFVLNLALLKRLNGYKPFLYNITIDACKFLSNPKVNPVANYFYEFVKPYTNANHTCPYNHHLIIDKVPIDFVDYRLTKLLPFPEGSYLVESALFVKGIKCGILKVYGTVS